MRAGTCPNQTPQTLVDVNTVEQQSTATVGSPRINNEISSQTSNIQNTFLDLG